MNVNVKPSARPDGSLFGGFVLPSDDQSLLFFPYSNASMNKLSYLFKI